MSEDCRCRESDTAAMPGDRYMTADNSIRDNGALQRANGVLMMALLDCAYFGRRGFELPSSPNVGDDYDWLRRSILSATYYFARYR